MNDGKFSFTDLVQNGLQIVSSLVNTSFTNEEKLAELDKWVTATVEEVDDLVSFLPLGLRDIAVMVVDNDGADSLEHKYVSRPIAEMIYQAWKMLARFGIKVASDAPYSASIGEVSSSDGPQ